MHDTQPLPLQLTPALLAEFCRQIRLRCDDPAQALQQLTAVQALLGACVTDRAHPAYGKARATLDTHLETLRAAVLDRHAAALANAMRERDAAAVAHSFVALSRSGFAAAATRAWALLDAALRPACGEWLGIWCADAEARAAAASRFPDAPDYRAAGIALESVLAMQELRKAWGI